MTTPRIAAPQKTIILPMREYRFLMIGMFIAGMWAGYLLCNLVNR